MTLRRDGGEDGYALLVAVIAMAVLAGLAIGLTATARTHLDLAAARIERARLKADADAGVVLAVRALAMTGRERRWIPDGRPHSLVFDGASLVVRIEDERGKIALNEIDEKEVRAMFAALGVEGDALDALTDAFLDWRDPDNEVRPHGAEAAYYAPLGRKPRNGPLRSLDEMLEIRGMTRALFARLRPAASVVGAEGEGFDERYAQPLALEAMGSSAVAIAEREREVAGDREALPLNAADDLVGRGMMVRVDARNKAGERFAESVVIQLTGRHERPYVVRAIDMP